MRISDWSSDVCSSDLQFPGRHWSAYSDVQSRAHRAARHNAPPRFPGSPVAASPSIISFAVPVRQTVLWRPTGICPLTLDLYRRFGQDRKSAVKGTSVAVRVYLGCGRLIKKKKNNSTQTKNK